LAVITTYNGFGFRPDTVGDTIAVATPLTISGGSITANGIIENRDDVDVYSFITGTGPVSININTAIGANLDVRADLYNSAGNWVATANDLASLNISLNVTLPEGVYYLKVDGVGVGNPLILPPSGYTDYGSIGQYSITGSITPPIGSSVSVNTKSSTKSEGNIGSTSFTFTVTRSGNLSQSATVNYSVAGSGSTPADSTDFVGGQFPSGSVTFAPNISMLPVTILVRGDTTIETEERFSVTLGNPSSGMTIAAAAAIGIIKNDDPISVVKSLTSNVSTFNNAKDESPYSVLTIAPSDMSQSEGTEAGPTPFTFSITRSGEWVEPATVRYTVEGFGVNPASDDDFAGGFRINEQVDFDTYVHSVLITLDVVADSNFELDENFRISLSDATGATITSGSITGSIYNDDLRKVNQVKIGQDSQIDDSGTQLVDRRHDGDVNLDRDLVIVATPLWAFIPPLYLTAAELDVPMITWINGVPHFGDRAPAYFADLKIETFEVDNDNLGVLKDHSLSFQDSDGVDSKEVLVGAFGYEPSSKDCQEIDHHDASNIQSAASHARGWFAADSAMSGMLDAAIVEERDWLEPFGEADGILELTGRDDSIVDALFDDALADWAIA
jgi:hypothetical protein